MRIVYFLLLTVFAISAFAQNADSLKRYKSSGVIVTGFPAEAGKTPVPVTEIPRAEIQAQAPFKELPGLLKQLPSMVTYSQSGLDFGYINVNIRGFDQRRESILVNGIPQNDPEDHSVYWIDMTDLSGYASNIEIQRGAGSAFYGPPAIGGSINVETFPSAERSFTLSAMGGSFGTSKFVVAANTGLLDGKYIASARLTQFHTDGYRNYSFSDLKSYYVSLARLDDNSTIQFNFYGGIVNDGLDYWGISKSEASNAETRKTNYSESFGYERRPQEQEHFFQPHYELLSSIIIGENLTLYNTFFYIRGEGQFDFDGTWPNLLEPYPSHSVVYRLTPEYGLRYGFMGITDTILGNELTRAYVANDHGGWLPRLEYKHNDGMFILGGEARIHRSLHWGQLLSAEKLPVGLPGDYHFYEYSGGKDMFSGYISEVYALSSDLNLSASVQLLGQTYHFGNEKPTIVDSSWVNYSFDVPLFFVNPRAGLNYNFSENSSAFISGSYTSREPRLKDYYNAEATGIPKFNRSGDGAFDFSSPIIKPEHLIDLELGFRSKQIDLDDDLKASIGLTGYYMSFSDELLKTGEKDLWGSSVLANAEEVLHYGLEFEGGIEYSTVVALVLNFTSSHNEIKEFTKYSDTIDVVGNSPIGFPTLISNVTLLIQPVEQLHATFSLRHIGAMYGDIENTTDYQNDPYTVFDLSIGYTFKDILGLEHLALRAQINNVFDVLYTSYADRGSGFFVGAPRNGYLNIEIGL